MATVNTGKLDRVDAMTGAVTVTARMEELYYFDQDTTATSTTIYLSDSVEEGTMCCSSVGSPVTICLLCIHPSLSVITILPQLSPPLFVYLLPSFFCI